MPNLKEYIEELQKIVREHGDEVEMVDEEGESVAMPEFVDDGDEPCVVVCAKR